MEENFQKSDLGSVNQDIDVPIKKQSYRRMLPSPACILIMALLLGALIFSNIDKIKTLTSDGVTQQIPEQVEEKFSYQQKNIVVFTRCFGEDRQFSQCNLYTSSLKEPEEQLVFTFDFPEVEHTEYTDDFSLSINGVANKKVVYTKKWWEQEEGTITKKIKVGFIDLLTGDDTEIYSQSMTDKERAQLHDLFVDSEYDRVFYSDLYDSPSNHRIVQYDLEIEQSSVISGQNGLDFPHMVIGANEDQVFLSKFQESVFDVPSWSRTIDLPTYTMVNIDEPLEEPVFDKNGEYVAYILKEEISKDRYNLSLLVSKTDGTEKKLINKITNTKLPNGFGSYTSFSSYSFNPNGTILSYSIYAAPDVSPNGNSLIDQSLDRYLTIFRTHTELRPGEKGIKILPPNNEMADAQPVVVEPTNIDYRWIEYQLFSGPLEGTVQNGLVYQADGGWFFSPAYFEQNNKLDLFQERKVIAVNADNLYVIKN